MGSPLDRMYTDTMEPEETAVFHQILEYIGRGACTAKVDHISHDSIRKAINAARMTNPDFTNRFSERYTIVNRGYEYVLEFEPLLPPETLKRYEKKSQEAVAKLVRRATEHSSNQYETVLNLHDELVKGVMYSTERTERHPNIYNSFAPLVDKVAACQGISLAFLLLCRECNIECGAVCNMGMLHAWNMVGIDGHYCNIDATWDLNDDDPYRDYLNISDRRFMSNHLCKLGPQCTTDKYDWYRMNGLYMADLSDVYDCIKTSYSKGKHRADLEYGNLLKDDVFAVLKDLQENYFRKSSSFILNDKINVVHVEWG